MSEKFVIVHRSYDPILIEHLAEMLREADVTVRAVGTRDAALIGMGSSIAELHLSVPQSQAAEASDFLDSFFSEEGEALLEKAGLLDDEEDEEDEESEEDSSWKLSASLAGIAVLFCGLGHLYARRRITGGILALAFIAVFMMFAASPYRLVVGGFSINAFGLPLAMLTLMILDFVGAQFAVRAFNRGEVRSSGRQIVAGMLSVSLACGAAVIPSLGRPLDDVIVPEFSMAELERELEERPYFEYQLPGLIDPGVELVIP